MAAARPELILAQLLNVVLTLLWFVSHAPDHSFHIADIAERQIRVNQN